MEKQLVAVEINTVDGTWVGYAYYRWGAGKVNNTTRNYTTIDKRYKKADLPGSSTASVKLTA